MARKPTKRTKAEAKPQNCASDTTKQSPPSEKSPQTNADKRLNAAFDRITEELLNNLESDCKQKRK